MPTPHVEHDDVGKSPSSLAQMVVLHTLLASYVVASLAFSSVMQRNWFGPSAGQVDLINALLGAVPGLASAVAALNKVSTSDPAFSWSLAALCAIYVLAMVLGRAPRCSGSLSFLSLLAWSFGAALPILFLPNLLSVDVIDYLNHGRTVAVYGANPYRVPIAAFPEDPFRWLTVWGHLPTVYGPIWVYLCVAIAWLVELMGAGLTSAVTLFRIIGLSSTLLGGWLIWIYWEHAPTAERAFSAAIFLLNPLVIIEFSGNAHNEAVMSALLLAGFVAYRRHCFGWTLLAFTGAALVKIYALPILLLYLAWRFWRRPRGAEGWFRLVALGVASMLVIVFLYLPFGLDRATLAAPLTAPGVHSMTKSLGELVLLRAGPAIEATSFVQTIFEGDAQRAVRSIALTFVAGYCVLAAFKLRRSWALSDACLGYALLWCLIGATWYMPWYATIALALAAISSAQKLRVAAIVLSLSSLVIYVMEANSPAGGVRLYSFIVRNYHLFVFLPPMAALAFGRLHSWANRHTRAYAIAT